MKARIFSCLGLLGLSALLMTAPDARAGYAFLSGYAVINTNGGTSGGDYFDLGFTSTSNPDFLNRDLGTYQVGSTQLRLNGFEYNIWDDGPDNVFDAQLFYRVFPTNSPSGSYTPISGSFSFQTGNDERWERLNAGANLVGALPVGNYQLEVFAQMTADWGNGGSANDGTVWIGSSGTVYNPPTGSAPLFLANFQVIPEPASAVALLGALGGVLSGRRRRR